MAQFNNVDKLSLLVASLAHDLGHDGFSNGFHKTFGSNLKQLFGNSQIQEYWHAAQTIQLLERPEFDFISSNFSTKEVALIKKRIVNSILYTDMAIMKDLRTELQTHLDKFAIKNGKNTNLLVDRSTPETEEASKQLISSALLHAADISTSIRSFEISEVWADRLFSEFFAQGDYEREHGMEVSFLCDRNTTEIAGGQGGFINFVVIPIFKQLNDISGCISSVQIKSGLRNVELFKIKAEAEKVKAAEAIQEKHKIGCWCM